MATNIYACRRIPILIVGKPLKNISLNINLNDGYWKFDYSIHNNRKYICYLFIIHLKLLNILNLSFR